MHGAGGGTALLLKLVVVPLHHGSEARVQLLRLQASQRGDVTEK